MIDLSKNPFSDKNGNPLTGQEIEWLNWNSKARSKANPFVDADGNIMKNKVDAFSKYMNDCQESYQSDLLKLPLSIRQNIENNNRLLSERMQVEATGRR